MKTLKPLDDTLVIAAIKDSIKFASTLGSTRNQIIRRAAYYIKITKPLDIVKCYYDDPGYPGWSGKFIETGLKDYRGRMYGLKKVATWSDKEYIQALRTIRSVLARGLVIIDKKV